MKSLFLLRHAKSSWGDLALSDEQRPLNERGRAAAQAMGREMAALGLDFDIVLASPAARTLETVARVEQALGRALAARREPRLYLATTAELLAIVHAADDGADRLLLVGHNPGFALLADMLAGDDNTPQRAALVEKYPTGALAEIAFPVEHWHDIAPGTGQLVRFIRPRDLGN